MIKSLTEIEEFFLEQEVIDWEAELIKEMGDPEVPNLEKEEYDDEAAQIVRSYRQQRNDD